MPYFILAVLLTVMQATPPVPRQAPDKPARTRNSVKQDSNKKQNPPDVRMRLPTTAESNQPEGQEQCSHDTHETVIIREPAAVPQTDWWTHASVIATWLLVIIGGLGVCAALKTLKGIKRQADLMEGGLYVDGVRMIKFEEYKNPICFVKIANSGPFPKTVSIAMNLRLANQITHYRHDQAITIPAHGSHEAFILSRRSFHLGDVPKVECGIIPLRVYGHIRTQKETVEYCYKYTQWSDGTQPHGTRPQGLPDFVTCDFDTETAMSGIAEVIGVGATASAGQITASAGTVEHPPSETPKEPDDPT
jgi:hypothetical protein